MIDRTRPGIFLDDGKCLKIGIDKYCELRPEIFENRSLFDNREESEFEINGTVDKRARDGAFKLYLNFRKRDKPVPKPLQEYIDWGIERTLAGERSPFPVSKSTKVHPYFAYFFVQAFMELRNIDQEQAIKEVASLFDQTEKNIEVILKKLRSDNHRWHVYYLAHLFLEK